MVINLVLQVRYIFNEIAKMQYEICQRNVAREKPDQRSIVYI